MLEGDPLEIALLGGLRVRSAEATVTGEPFGRRAELVFARLALSVGRVVPREALASVVWGELLPESWPAALRNVIAREHNPEAFWFGGVGVLTAFHGVATTNFTQTSATTYIVTPRPSVYAGAVSLSPGPGHWRSSPAPRPPVRRVESHR